MTHSERSKRYRDRYPERYQAANRASYEKNKEKYKATARLRRRLKPEECRIANTRYGQIARGYINKAKAAPCVDCGNSYPPYVMDFDHVRGVKLAEVGRLGSRGAPLQRIIDEIAKCDLVCSNCHRIRTFTRGKDNGR